jgi:hypothetical protein
VLSRDIEEGFAYPGFVDKGYLPICRWRQLDRRGSHRHVDKVQLDTFLAFAIGLYAVMADGLVLVALEVPVPAGQTACAHPFGLAGLDGRVERNFAALHG